MAVSQGTFASLSQYNYRLFAIGSLISNIGGWMAIVAQDWLVLTILTDQSSVALGLVTALQFLPVAILAPFAGALADRIDKRKLLVVTQSCSAAGTVLLFVLLAAGLVQLWHVCVLAAFAGVLMSFDNPTRHAFVSEMVPARLLPNAIGLNSASFNAARLIGPGVSGLIIGTFGVAPAIAVNAISYVGPISALLLMRTSELVTSEPAPRKRAVREGVSYVKNRPEILLVLFVVFMTSTFGMNYQLTNALMATRVFGKGAQEFGLLGSILAVGSLSAALIAARRARPRLRVLFGSLAGYAFFSTALGLAPNYVIFALLLVPVGLCALTIITTANSMIQLAAAPEYRGRVMSLYTAILLGGTPIGAPLIGWIGQAWGPRWTLLIGAIAAGLTFVAGLTFLIRHENLRVGLKPVWPPHLQVEKAS